VPSHAENKDAGVTTLVPSPSDVQILPELTANRVSGNAGIELHSVRVRASSNPVGTEPLRFRVQISEIGTKPDPFRFGSSLTAKTCY
jgi:hypothetical protein